MTSGNQVDVELLCKRVHHIFIEHVAHSTLALRPVGNLILFGVRPQKIAKQTLVWNVRGSLDHFKIAVVVEFLTQAAMHAQDFIINESSNGQLLEDANELLEHFAVLLVIARKLEAGFTLPLEQRFVEAIDEGQIVALVISSEQEKVLGVLDFESEQKKNGFDLHWAPTLIVSQEQVVCFRWPSLHVEDLAKVGKLAVNVADQLHRRLQLQEDRLTRKDLVGLDAKLGDVFLADLDILDALRPFGVGADLLVSLEVEILECRNDSVSHGRIRFHYLLNL